MRYELTDAEKLVIKQDQINRDLRVKEQLTAELDAAYPADDEQMPRAMREDGIKLRIRLVQDRLDKTIADAKVIEKRVKS